MTASTSSNDFGIFQGTIKWSRDAGQSNQEVNVSFYDLFYNYQRAFRSRGEDIFIISIFTDSETRPPVEMELDLARLNQSGFNEIITSNILETNNDLITIRFQQSILENLVKFEPLNEKESQKQEIFFTNHLQNQQNSKEIQDQEQQTYLNSFLNELWKSTCSKHTDENLAQMGAQRRFWTMVRPAPGDESRYIKIKVLLRENWCRKFANLSTRCGDANFYAHFLNQNQNPVRMTHSSNYLKSILTKNATTCIILKELALGIFLDQPLPLTFHRYFSTISLTAQPETNRRFVRNRVEQPFIQMFIHTSPEHSSNTQMIFILQIHHIAEIKFEYSYCYSPDIIKNKGETDLGFFFKLLSPPRISFRRIQPHLYVHPLCELKWERIYNFTLLQDYLNKLDQQEGRNNTFDELIRLFLFNNSYLYISVDWAETSEAAMISALLESTGRLRDEQIGGKIWLQQNPNLQLYKNLDHFNMTEQLDFESKYLLLCYVAHNRIPLESSELPAFLDSILTLRMSNSVEAAFLLLEFFKASTREKRNENIQLFRQFVETSRKSNFFQIKQRTETDSNKYYQIRRVFSTPSGIIYCIPEIEVSNSVLRKTWDLRDNWLRVSFTEEDLSSCRSMNYVNHRLFRLQLNGFYLYEREYEGFCWSASQIKQNSLWCLQKHPSYTRESIVNLIGDLSHIKIPGRFAARLGQGLATSFHFTCSPVIRTIEDIRPLSASPGVGKDALFTDGIGLISDSLIQDLKLQYGFIDLQVIQVRLGGAKGVLVANPDIPDNEIHLRPSMIKFAGEINGLAFLNRNKYLAGYLNRQIILLLCTAGISEILFEQLQAEYISQLKNLVQQTGKLYQYMNLEFDANTFDHRNFCSIVQRLVDNNYRINDEPFMQGLMQTLKIKGLTKLRKRANILMEKAVRLIGIIDEYGILNETEVYCCYQPEGRSASTVEGRVVLARNPCLHPGDVRLMQAIGPNEIMMRANGINKFEMLKNCIIFPQKGKVPFTSQISGSDLDGDIYFLSWDERITSQLREFEPMDYTSQMARKVTSNIEFSDLMDFFVEFMGSDLLGRIDNSHLAIADASPERANDPKCLKLAQYHSDAVDFVKTGYMCHIDDSYFAKTWPHYMEKGDFAETYESKSVLGRLYDSVVQEIEQARLEEAGERLHRIDKNFLYKSEDIDLYDDSMITQAIQDIIYYRQIISGNIHYFGLLNEFEYYTGNLSNFNYHRNERKINYEFLQPRIAASLGEIREQFSTIFFQNLPDDKIILLRHGRNFSIKARIYASLWYLLSYATINNLTDEALFVKIKQNHGNNLKVLFQRASDDHADSLQIGLPWLVVADILFVNLEANREVDDDIDIFL